MMFPVKAVFWTLVVAAFVPKGFSAPEDGAFAQEAALFAAQFNPGDVTGDFEAAAEDVCAGRETTCEVIGEASNLAGFMVDLAAAKVEHIADSRTQGTAAPTAEQIFAEAAGERTAR